MIIDGAEVFLGVPDDSGECALHPGTVVATSGSLCTTRLIDREVCPAPGRQAFLYRDVAGRFMRQAARVEAIIETAPKPVVVLELAGFPVTAERRQSRRVSYLSLCDQAFRELVPE